MAPTTKDIKTWFPRVSSPFICNAPMYGFANAELAIAVTKAGGLGFIGGGFDFSSESKQIPALSSELARARNLIHFPSPQATLPVGVGFITFRPEGFVQNIIPVVSEHRPAAIWLFAPASRDQHAEIVPALKSAGAAWGLKVFVQVGTVQSAREAVEDGCDVLVVQGSDAGGHQWAQGASLISLVPETRDMLSQEFEGANVAVVAAGGIVDGRGIAAQLALGANGVVMGTRFLVTEECPAPTAMKNIIMSTTDGGVSTVKSTVHDTMQGTGFWPQAYDGRAIIGESYKDHIAGLPEDANIIKYKDALAAGDSTRRTVWAGSGVGLIKSILPAGEVILNAQKQTREILQSVQSVL
ncbi:hypothetical protein MMC14_004656 [Varicellaria rhodocarpa]|nr:hypothetical protein [Varicellaria rhodocarpa]